jgi:hypothetical protein
MKKNHLAVLLPCLLLFAACSKTKDIAPPAVPAQTWIFKGATYNTVICFADTVTNNLGVHANNGSVQDSTNYSAILVNFYGAALPTSNGTYSVALVNTPVTSLTRTQVTISFTLGGRTNVYQSTGGNGNETVSVSISNGKLSILGAGIELENYNSSTAIDSAALSFNITEAQ